MKRKTEQISVLIKQTVERIDPKAQIILYGSRVRGMESIDSDWGILILTDYTVDIVKERVFRNAFYDLELETEELFSVFIYSKTEWETKQRITPFYFNVINEGIRI